MEIRQLVKAVKRWWWIGIVPAAIVLIYIIVTYEKPPVTYQVAMRFATGGEPATALSDDYDRYYAWLSSEYIANGLADIATSDSFASHISDALKEKGWDISPASVRAAIASDNTQSTTFIYVTWHDLAQVVDLAEIISAALIRSGPVYYPQMSQIGPVARLIDAPTAYPLAPSLRTQLVGPAIRLALAAGLGCGLILAAFILDPTIREADDLIVREISYLGCIPKT